MPQRSARNLVGLDLNSTRVRAVQGHAGTTPRPVSLDGQPELPMALSLEGRTVAVGQPGVAVCRRLPHLACLDFLPSLGEPRQWAAGKHRLDAAEATRLVLRQLQPACGGAGVTVAVPAYLTHPQVGLLAVLAEEAGLRLLGSLTGPLAAAAAASLDQPWSGLAVVLDADDHALTWTALNAEQSGPSGQAVVLAEEVFPHLGLRVWKERILNVVADCCIRRSRRDPRESAAAEQALYEQLDGILEACRKGELAEVTVRSASWYQSLVLRPEEIETCCGPLVRQTLDGMRATLAACPSDALPETILVTSAAGRLPGLRAALNDHTPEQTTICLLPPDAVARGAHDLAGRLQAGELAADHFDAVVPLRKLGKPRAAPPAPTIPLRDPKASRPDDDFSVAIDE
jgi:hypothetical protein